MLASLRHIERCHLPIKGICWHQGEKDIVGFKPYHLGNSALWDLDHVAKYHWIKTGQIMPYHNLRL